MTAPLRSGRTEHDWWDTEDQKHTAHRLSHRNQQYLVRMVYRGRYHVTQARQHGAADDVVAYLSTHTKTLGILKHKRRSPKDGFLADVTQHGIP